jgi:hypothetical protein
MKINKEKIKVLVCGREKVVAKVRLNERDWNKWNHSPALEVLILGMGEAHQTSSIK